MQIQEYQGPQRRSGLRDFAQHPKGCGIWPKSRPEAAPIRLRDKAHFRVEFLHGVAGYLLS